MFLDDGYRLAWRARIAVEGEVELTKDGHSPNGIYGDREKSREHLTVG